MSELRQRHGGASGSSATHGLQPVPQEPLTAEAFQEWIDTTKRKPPKPGLSDAAKAAKDALDADPFNMELILKLGVCYMQDDQWDRCMNVMVRGMKRISELQEPEQRLQFGSLLCHASLEMKKYQQALAVLIEMEEPTEKEQIRAFCMLSCRVNCYSKRVPEAMKALNRLLDGEKGVGVCTNWAVLATAFKQAGPGAYEAARSAVEKKLPKAEDRKKMEAMETLMELRNKSEEPESTFVRSNPFWVLVAVLAVLLVLFLYKLESQSLAKLSPNK